MGNKRTDKWQLFRREDNSIDLMKVWLVEHQDEACTVKQYTAVEKFLHLVEGYSKVYNREVAALALAQADLLLMTLKT